MQQRQKLWINLQKHWILHFPECNWTACFFWPSCWCQSISDLMLPILNTTLLKLVSEPNQDYPDDITVTSSSWISTQKTSTTIFTIWGGFVKLADFLFKEWMSVCSSEFFLSLSVCGRWRVTPAACGAVRWRLPRWSAAPPTGHCVCGTPKVVSVSTRCMDTHRLCAVCISTATGNYDTHTYTQEHQKKDTHLKPT